MINTSMDDGFRLYAYLGHELVYLLTFGFTCR